ncbi:acyltransferase [Arthrobacter sulfonylureivorans]|uniref:Acyltransferase n=1 Tax=Arthrobacter sulfonylureivorans TaxID=2486855 RepID=A0ABY3WA41_9MICC|nr:acyltransferase [Arthrobacter sulfonylureivorans]UNK46008.1 acyltransferase [Arthrobacter sulfonylureivorans]
MAVPSPSPSGQLDGAAPRPRRNYALDILRIVSIVGVVAIHSFGELAGDDDARSQPDWLPAAIIDIAFIWVVPVFVTISGALVLAPRAHTEGAKAFYRKRALRLLPALVVWHLVYIFIGNYLILGRELQPREVLVSVFDTQVYPHLYFLWLILGLYLVAPPLAGYLNRVPLQRAAAATCAVLVLTLALFSLQAASIQFEWGWEYPWNILTQWFPYLGYFMAGWVITQLRVPRGAAIAAGGAAVVLSVFNIWHWINKDSTPLLNIITPSSYVGLGVTTAALCIFTATYHLLAGWQPASWLGRTLIQLSNASFGVFLCHYLFLTWLTFHVFPDQEPTLALISLKFSIATVGSFALTLLALRTPVLNRVF